MASSAHTGNAFRFLFSKDVENLPVELQSFVKPARKFELASVLQLAMFALF